MTPNISYKVVSMTTNKWEKFADSFEENNNYVVGLNDIKIVKDSFSSFSDSGNVLELGCGNGTYTECFVDSSIDITATDLSEDMVSVAVKRFKNTENVTVEQADCFNLKYSESSYDTVFMANLLHIVPNPEALLSECFRVLKDGGQLIVVSFTLHGMTFLNQLQLKYRYLKTYGSKSSKSIILTPELAEKMSEISGFKNIKTSLIGKSVKAVLFTAEKPHNN